MSKPWGRVLGAGVLALALALPAQAQSTYKLTSAGSTTAFGYYVGPYQAVTLLNGIPSVPFKVYCVDFFHESWVGQVWQGNATTLTSGDLSLTRGGNAALEQYEKAAWLTWQFQLNPTSSWGNIHATIWNVMNPGAPGLPTPSSSYWLNQVNANWQTVDPSFYSKFVVITPTNLQDPTSAQEYLRIVSTPEPQSEVLLGFGLMAVAVLLWWRRHSLLA